MWGHRHLLGIDPLSVEDISELLTMASVAVLCSRQKISKVADLSGKTIVNLFFEASTRTRSSFELAGKRLGADVVNVAVSTSSVTKGETLLDTVRTLEAMHADAIVLRHPASGAADFVAARTGSSIINAGDGAHEHPTQALLDALTIQNHKGRLSGLVVAKYVRLARFRHPPGHNAKYVNSAAPLLLPRSR
jgi:aspartate carbamoyltransferase catalytic subunit